MNTLAWLLPLHIACISMLVGVLLWRLFYVWQGRAIPYAWLKRGLPDLIDMAVLFTGVSLAVYFSAIPWEHVWFAVKLLLVLCYIAAGFVCFSSRYSLPTNRAAALCAIAILMSIAYVATTKHIV